MPERNSLTIDPIKLGFQEYETQMNAVQTILANTQQKSQQLNQQAITSVREQAQVSIQATKESLQKSLEDTRDFYDEKIKARKAAQEIDIGRKTRRRTGASQKH